MFGLHEKLNRLDIPAQKVLRLQKSLGDVQIALPGQHSQMATAYICAFSAGNGARVTIAFHMKNDFKLIYYLNDGGEISRENAGSVLNQAIHFAESLGFMMSDLEFHKMDAAEKEPFWESLPLKNPPVRPVSPAAAKPTNKKGADAAVEGGEEPNTSEAIDLDLGLPRRRLAVSKVKKKPPTPAELEEKRGRLRENLGRFLSSL